MQASRRLAARIIAGDQDAIQELADFRDRVLGEDGCRELGEEEIKAMEQKACVLARLAKPAFFFFTGRIDCDAIKIRRQRKETSEASINRRCPFRFFIAFIIDAVVLLGHSARECYVSSSSSSFSSAYQ